MVEKELHSWEEFLAEVENLRQFRNNEKASLPKGIYTPDWIFRGQPDSNFHLETTLERSKMPNQRLTDYYSLIQKVKDKVEANAKKRWDKFPNDESIKEKLKSINSTNLRDLLEAFPELVEYMIYLRHYGFPSPLLDWSESPYIAAYFAFSDCQRDAKSVAIFAFLDRVFGKAHRSFGPGMSLAEPYITLVLEKNVHLPQIQRHNRQKGRYTICTEGVGIDLHCHCHESVVGKQNPIRDALQQDILWKFILPINEVERKNVLRELERININGDFLFQTREKFMETVFLREHFN